MTVTSGEQSGKWLALISVLVLADIVSGVESMMIYSAMKTMITLYGDGASVGWLVTAYLLVSAASAAIFGRLGDLYGRKRMILIVLACAVIGSLISAMTKDLTVMIIGRALQGVSGAIMALSFGLAREVLPPGKLPLAIGILYSAGAIGGTGGMVLGGILVDAGAWHSLFLVGAAVAGLSFLFTAIALPPGAGASNPGKIDKLGGILFVPAVAAMLLGLTNIRAWGLFDSRILLLLAGGAGLFAIWLRYEWRHPDPLINVRLFARREALTALLCIGLFAAGGAQAMQLQMLFLQQPVATGIGLGVSATLAGVALLVPNLTAVLMSPVGGYLVSLRGNRFVVMTGFLLNLFAWLSLMVFNDDLWTVVALVSFGCMAGNALLGVGIYNAVISAAPLDRTSEASGVLTVMRGLSHAIGAQLIMVILASSTITSPMHGGHPAPSGYLTVFAMIAGLSVVGVILGAGLKGPPRSDAPEQPTASPHSAGAITARPR